jgi:hypothetical protein
MAQYLLSVHSVERVVSAPMTDDEMPQSYKHIGTLEDEIESAGARALSGGLHGRRPRLCHRTKPDSTSTYLPGRRRCRARPMASSFSAAIADGQNG